MEATSTIASVAENFLAGGILIFFFGVIVGAVIVGAVIANLSRSN